MVQCSSCDDANDSVILRDFYRPHLCHSVHGGGVYPSMHWGRYPPGRQWGVSQHALGQKPPRRHPPGRHPPDGHWQRMVRILLECFLVWYITGGGIGSSDDNTSMIVRRGKKYCNTRKHSSRMRTARFWSSGGWAR